MQNYQNNMNWDDSIPDTPPKEYKPLKPGVYFFEVTGTERGVWPDSAKKLHGAKKMEITLRLSNGEDEGEGTGTLTLHRDTAYKIRQFFRCIGCNVVSGESYVPQWNLVQGARGRCKVKTRTWSKDGKEYFSNEVDEWLEPVAGAAAMPPPSAADELTPF